MGVAASPLANGTLSTPHVTIILSGRVQNIGQILGVVIGVPARFSPLLGSVTLMNAAIRMVVTRLILRSV